MQSRDQFISDCKLQMRSVDIMLTFLRARAATRHMRIEQLDIARLTQLRQRAGHNLADFEGTHREVRRSARLGLLASLRELTFGVDDAAHRYAAHILSNGSATERLQPQRDLSGLFRPEA